MRVVVKGESVKSFILIELFNGGASFWLCVSRAHHIGTLFVIHVSQGIVFVDMA